MNKILVTGGTGFIGSFLIKTLIRNNTIRALVRKTSNISELRDLKKNKKLEIVYGDLNNFESLDRATKNVDTVIHCAVLHGNFTYNQLYNTNVIGTKNLLEACEKNKIKRFIHFSSAVTFGKIENGNENSPRNPETDYAKTKYKGEIIIREYMKKNIFPITVLIPPLVYGPHKRSNMIKWFKYINKGYFMIFGKGNNSIEVLYIDDLIKAVLLVLKNKKNEMQTYIISGQTSTMNEFTEVITNIERVKKSTHIPIWLAYSIGFSLGAISKILKFDPPISITKVKNMTRSRSLDISKAKKELKYEPKVSIHKGIEKVVIWCKKNKIIK